MKKDISKCNHEYGKPIYAPEKLQIPSGYCRGCIGNGFGLEKLEKGNYVDKPRWKKIC